MPDAASGVQRPSEVDHVASSISGVACKMDYDEELPSTCEGSFSGDMGVIEVQTPTSEHSRCVCNFKIWAGISWNLCVYNV